MFEIRRGSSVDGSWPGVGGGNYSDAGVEEKCRGKKGVVEQLLDKEDHRYDTKLYAFTNFVQ